MLTLQQILLGLIVPAVLTGVIALAAGWLAKQRWIVSASITLAMAGGFAVAYRPLTGNWPHFPPPESYDWILFGAFGLAVIGVLFNWLPFIARALLAFIAPGALVWMMFQQLNQPFLWQWVVSFAVIAGILWLALRTIAWRHLGHAIPMVLLFFSGGTAAVLVLGDMAKLGFLAAALLAMSTALLVASLILRHHIITGGTLFLIVSLLIGLLAYGFITPDPKPMVLLRPGLLFIAPLLALLVEIPPIQSWKNWKRELLRAILVAAPIAIAVVLAYRQFRIDAADISGG